MLRRAMAIALAALVVLPAAAAAKPQAEVRTERAEAPFFMQSAQIRQQIDAAGARGLSYEAIGALVRLGLAGEANKDEPVADPCPTAEPNTESPSVHTNACITYPFGCTANFLYRAGSTPPGPVSDGRNDFIGTAGHCVEHSGQPVYMDNNDGAVVRVGEVFKHVNGGPGNDTALIRLDPGQNMDSEMPGVVGAPKGIYTECPGGQTVNWWGHGYTVAVGQGRLKAGGDTTWFNRQFSWTGNSEPGDSGSGVVTSDGLAAGDLTHLVIDPGRYGTDINTGTRMTNILAWAGNLKLVLADGKTLADAPRNTRCGNPNYGNG